MTDADDGPSDMERRLVSALPELYLKPVNPSDFETAADVSDPDEFHKVTFENLIPSVKVMKAKHSRYLALKFLWWKFKSESNYYDPWFYRFNIEALEMHVLGEVAETLPKRLEKLSDEIPEFIDLIEGIPRLDYAYNQYAILRGCAAIEQFLVDVVNTERYRERGKNGELEDIKFSKVINWAVEDSALAPIERETLHFVREVRNQTSHNMWLDKNYSLDVLILARKCAEKLIHVIMQRLSQKHEVVFDDVLADHLEEQKAELERLHERIEGELGWFYLEMEHRWMVEDSRDEPQT